MRGRGGGARGNRSPLGGWLSLVAAGGSADQPHVMCGLGNRRSASPQSSWSRGGVYASPQGGLGRTDRLSRLPAANYPDRRVVRALPGRRSPEVTPPRGPRVASAPLLSQRVVREESAVVPEWRILRHPPGGRSHDTARRAPRMSQILVRQLIHRPSTGVTHEGGRTCVNTRRQYVCPFFRRMELATILGSTVTGWRRE
jgi:hypothetical protein